MSSLREELGGRRTTATPYSILCPPGWRRVPAAALTDGTAHEAVIAQAKSAGRADLVLQLRTMSGRLRAALRDSKAFDLYLAPVVDDIPVPAAMVVAPFVLPASTTWDMALGRLSAGAPVEVADFTETRMWVWRRDERVSDSAASMVGRGSHYLVPVPDETDARRALHFHYTVLVADDERTRPLIDPLAAIGDLMMSTMRWLPVPADAAS